MYRPLFALLAVFAAALTVVGLTFSASVDAPAEFDFHNQAEPKTLDPHLATGSPEGTILRALFEGLTRRDSRTMSTVPGVAESWNVSLDGKTYTFHLRKEARWSDGHPVTASDFVYSLKRLLEPSLGAEYAYIVFPIRHAEAYNTYDGHARQIDETLSPALATLRAQNPRGVQAADWQRFLTKTGAHEPLRHDPKERLASMLSRRTGTVTARDLALFARSLPSITDFLRRQAEHARRHFGVDEGVIARDDHTLVIELDAPTPYFIDITSFYPMLPAPRWLTENPARRQDWFLPEHIVTNGPFTLTRWLVNDHLRLERSETYWGKDEVRLESANAYTIENVTTSLNLYLTGELDWLPDHYPLDLVDQLKQRADFHINQATVVYFYRINCLKPPLDDARVRRALNIAIDRTVIAENVMGFGQVPAYTLVPTNIPGYDPPKTAIAFDVPAARELLAEAGYPGGRGFPEIGILYNTLEMHKKIAEVVADQLRRNLGIRVTAYNQEWQSYQETTRNLDYDLSRTGWVADYLDPNTFLDLWVTNGGNNQTGFSSALYDRLLRTAGDVTPLLDDPTPLIEQLKQPERAERWIRAARSATDAKSRVDALAGLRLELLREAEALLVQDEFPIIPIYFYVWSNLIRPHVHGLYTNVPGPDGKVLPNLQDIHPLRDVWIEHEAKR